MPGSSSGQPSTDRRLTAARPRRRLGWPRAAFRTILGYMEPVIVTIMATVGAIVVILGLMALVAMIRAH